MATILGTLEHLFSENAVVCVDVVHILVGGSDLYEQYFSIPSQ